MKFHRFYQIFWNASIDRKYYWLFRIFWNRVCISFTNGDEPIRAKDLWLNAR
jgi:hypothetical protein